MQNAWLTKKKFPIGTKVKIIRDDDKEDRSVSSMVGGKSSDVWKRAYGASGEVTDVFLNTNAVPLIRVKFTSQVNGIDGNPMEFYYFFINQLEECAL